MWGMKGVPSDVEDSAVPVNRPAQPADRVLAVDDHRVPLEAVRYGKPRRPGPDNQRVNSLCHLIALSSHRSAPDIGLTRAGVSCR